MTQEIAHTFITVWFILFLWIDPLYDRKETKKEESKVDAHRNIPFIVNGKTSILHYLPKDEEA